MKAIEYFAFSFLLITTGGIARDCIPFVTVPQVLQNASKYHRQIIVIEGWTRSGPEYFTIQATKEPLQREQIWLENLKLIKATEALRRGQKKLRATNEPALDQDAQQKYRRFFSLKMPTHVVVKGEFQVLKESVPGYGSYKYYLIVYEVISIEE